MITYVIQRQDGFYYVSPNQWTNLIKSARHYDSPSEMPTLQDDWSIGEFNTNSDTVPPNELVNHPKHYNAHPSGVECITIIEHMTFNAGSAIKYLWRAGLKDSAPLIQDLKKAKWYIEREIARLEGDLFSKGMVYCKHCNKTHAVKEGETECSPGAWTNA